MLVNWQPNHLQEMHTIFIIFTPERVQIIAEKFVSTINTAKMSLAAEQIW